MTPFYRNFIRIDWLPQKVLFLLFLVFLIFHNYYIYIILYMIAFVNKKLSHLANKKVSQL